MLFSSVGVEVASIVVGGRRPVGLADSPLPHQLFRELFEAVRPTTLAEGQLPWLQVLPLGVAATSLSLFLLWCPRALLGDSRLGS